PQNDEQQKDGRKARRQRELHCSFRFFSSSPDQIDPNHFSNPLKAKPTATANAGPSDLTFSELTCGPTVMLLKGSRTSVRYEDVRRRRSGSPSMTAAPPLM